MLKPKRVRPKHVALIALAALVVSGPLQTMGLLPQTALGDASNSFLKKIAEILPGGASEVLQLFERRRLGAIHISALIPLATAVRTKPSPRNAMKSSPDAVRGDMGSGAYPPYHPGPNHRKTQAIKESLASLGLKRTLPGRPRIRVT